MAQSRTLAGLLTAIAAAIAALALLAPAASAAEPAPGYTQFKGCPTAEESPGSVLCIRSDVTGGHLQIGKKDVPIKNPLVIVGGINGGFAGFDPGSEGGLLPVKQEVPGGIIGLTGFDWLINFLGIEELKLYAISELAGTPGALFEDPLSLPIKVRLVNPILGNNCYVGTNSTPIGLKLTTGTTSPPPPNEPITGVTPEFGEDEELGILQLTDGTFVDNSFSAPGATGCVLKLFGFIPISLNGFVNEQSGLPAAAGTNEVVQEFDIEIALRALVYP